MSYKTILVHIDQSRLSEQRILVAARLAQQYGAHLVGVATTGISPFLFSASGLDPTVPPLVFEIDLLRKDALAALAAFETQAAAHGVASYESRLVDDEAGGGLSIHARYCDLAILSQVDATAPKPGVRTDFPEYVLLNCARPVLMIPATGTVEHVGSKVMVAWDGGIEATRALTSAIALMRRAAQVNLVVFDTADGSAHGGEPGADIALYLARHGIRVEVIQEPFGIDAGHALLDAVASSGSDLVVMGAYGHSRFREIMLGGTTRTMLAAMTVPVWMAH